MGIQTMSATKYLYIYLVAQNGSFFQSQGASRTIYTDGARLVASMG